MIELNLLPDVKLEYIKAQRSQRLVFGVAFLATAVSVGLLILLFSFGAFQKKHISDLTTDINSHVKELKGKPQIDKILTVQNQLNSLTGLHAAKPAASSLLSYFNQITPVQVSIGNLKVDFVGQTMTISGTTDALKNINTYVDTLKFTKFSEVGDDGSASGDSALAFSNVVLTNFSLTSDDKKATQTATYTIDLAYDPTIFDITKKVTLSVPQQVTTRSQLISSTDLFQAVPDTKKGSN
jgi:hypothetical protein